MAPEPASSTAAALNRRRRRFRRTAEPWRRDTANATATESRSGASIRATLTPPAAARWEDLASLRKLSRPLDAVHGGDALGTPSGREAMTALAAPAADDGSTCSIRHAMAEPVLPGTAAVVGLIRTLHVVSTVDRWFGWPEGAHRSVRVHGATETARSVAKGLLPEMVPRDHARGPPPTVPTTGGGRREPLPFQRLDALPGDPTLSDSGGLQHHGK